MSALGAILAGGQSRRYGSPKALARVGGRRIVDRVRAALAAVTAEQVLIANDASPFTDLRLPTRPDARPGLGALAGIHTALLWARELGRPGALAVACDMPFLDAGLLTRMLAEAEAGADVVAPESDGPRGVEPLCAYYSVRCLPAIEAEFARGERHIIGFYRDVTVQRIPRAEVERFGPPATLFMNVNSPADREAAERLAAALERGGASAVDAVPPRSAAR